MVTKTHQQKTNHRSAEFQVGDSRGKSKSSRTSRRHHQDDGEVKDKQRRRSSSPHKKITQRDRSPDDSFSDKYNQDKKHGHGGGKHSRDRSRRSKKHKNGKKSGSSSKARSKSSHRSKSPRRNSSSQEVKHDGYKTSREETMDINQKYELLNREYDLDSVSTRSSLSSTWRTDPTLWVAEQFVSWCVMSEVRIERMNDVVQRATCSPKSTDVRDDENPRRVSNILIQPRGVPETDQDSSTTSGESSTSELSEDSEKRNTASAMHVPSNQEEEDSHQSYDDDDDDREDPVGSRNQEIEKTEKIKGLKSELKASKAKVQELEGEFDRKKRRETSPKRRGTSPSRRETSPRRHGSSPNRRETSPNRRETSPKRHRGKNSKAVTRDSKVSRGSKPSRNEKIAKERGGKLPEARRVTSKRQHMEIDPFSDEIGITENVPRAVVAARIQGNDDEVSELSWMGPRQWRLFRGFRKGHVMPIEEDKEYIVPMESLFGNAVGGDDRKPNGNTINAVDKTNERATSRGTKASKTAGKGKDLLVEKHSKKGINQTANAANKKNQKTKTKSIRVKITDGTDPSSPSFVVVPHGKQDTRAFVSKPDSKTANASDKADEKAITKDTEIFSTVKKEQVDFLRAKAVVPDGETDETTDTTNPQGAGTSSSSVALTPSAATGENKIGSNCPDNIQPDGKTANNVAARSDLILPKILTDTFLQSNNSFVSQQSRSSILDDDLGHSSEPTASRTSSKNLEPSREDDFEDEPEEQGFEISF